MKTFMKTILTIILAMLLLASCHSKGGDEQTKESTSDVSEETIYPYQLRKLNGESIVYLNTSYGWGGNAFVIDIEEPGSSKVDSVRYYRNQKVEKDLDVVIEEFTTDDIWDMARYYNEAVLTEEDTYDCAYILMNQFHTVMFNSENLCDISTIHLDEAWWPQAYVNYSTINDTLYGTIDYTNLHSLTFTGGLYFNKGIARDKQLGNLYDDVRNDEWTYDKMGEYIRQVANLNGDEAFEPPYKGGNCIYGMIGNHNETQLILMQGSGQFLMKINDETGIPYLVEDLEPLSNIYDKLGTILSEDGHCVLINTTELTGGKIFWQEGRGLFLGDSMCGLLQLSSLNYPVEYGVLPLPKYDENQTSFYSPVSQYTLAFAIPRSAADSEVSGMVADYMNFCSLQDVYPTMLEAMCYKGLHDEDSIEMLNIILSNQIADIGHVNGWTQALLEILLTEMVNGNESRFISYIEAGRDVLNNAAMSAYEPRN